MNWTSIRSTLKTVVESIDGLTHSGAVEWADTSAAGVFRNYPRVDLSVRSIVAYGDDEARIDVDELDVRTEYLSGHRRFTWSIRVESDRAGSGQVLTVSDRIRTRLARRDAYATLLAAELAVADLASTQVLEFEKDGRRYTVAVLDVFMNCAENDTDESDNAGETVEQASISSEYLLNPDGEQNPRQVDFEVSSSD